VKWGGGGFILGGEGVHQMGKGRVAHPVSTLMWLLYTARAAGLAKKSSTSEEGGAGGGGRGARLSAKFEGRLTQES
jgi:hypothetical protein